MDRTLGLSFCRLNGLALALPPGLARCASVPAVDSAARAAMAPTGTLRVALYPGSPASLVIGRDGQRVGVTYELGQLAGQRLGVPVQFLDYPRPAELFDAVKSGRVDLSFTNASEARMREADFAPPLVRVESGYLMAGASGITDIARIDQPGVSIGVSDGGSSHAALTRELKQARVLPFRSLDIVERMLQSGELQGFASNKAVLFEMGERVPGSQVLPGRWAFENFALVVPRGREPAALEWTRGFGASLHGTPELQGMVSRAGLRGVATD